MVDAETAGRECVRQALAGRTPVAGDLVFVFPNATYDLQALHRGPARKAVLLRSIRERMFW